jgi:hypothetical protein
MEHDMYELVTADDLSARDEPIRINSYTTVLRRTGVLHEAFDNYWRDVHGPLCARIPGLAWYVQNHFSRGQDSHLWPSLGDVMPFPDYVLDGGVEIGFASEQDQALFTNACPILFDDEQNVFEETIAYALPVGSRTIVDHIVDPNPNGADSFDRLHVHFGARGNDHAGFKYFMMDLAGSLSKLDGLLKMRLHLPEIYDNAKPAPPAPNVRHSVPPERTRIAVMELVFVSPLTRRAAYASETFRATVDAQMAHLRFTTAFPVNGIYTYVRDKELTTAGLRGSRQAELIAQLGAANQMRPEVVHLLQFGHEMPN